MKYILFSNNTLLRTKINYCIAPDKCIFKNDGIFEIINEAIKTDEVIIILDERYKGKNFYTLTQLVSYKELKIIQIVKDLPTESVKLNKHVYLVRNPKEDDYTTLCRIINRLAKAKEVKLSLVEDDEEFVNSILIGESLRMKKLKKDILNIYKSDANILLLGETGSGKNLVANIIHKLRYGTKKEMLNLDCAFFNTVLAESRLLGHKKGSFTGADTDQAGLIEQGMDTTIYFDEIETLNIDSQPYLLRLINEKRFYRIGEVKERYTNAHMIFSSNEDIIKLEAEGKMRKDLIMRMSQEVIEVPTLNERLEDIPLLVRYLEAKNNYETQIKNYDLFFRHSWTGNVRELEDTIKRIHIRDSINAIPTQDSFCKFLQKKSNSLIINPNM